MRTGQSGHADAWSAAIAVLCTGVGVVVFFTMASPALQERTRLHEVETEHVRLRDELARHLHDLKQRTTGLTRDPQTILLAIDEAGLTPAELLGEPIPGMPPVEAWVPLPRVAPPR